MNLGTLLLVTKRLQTAAQNTAATVPITPPLTPGEVSVLEFLLARRKSVPIREIVSRTGIAQSWVSNVVQSLLKRGWVEVATDEKDRRSTTVTVKPELAAAARKTLSRDASSALSDLLSTASKDELKTIQRGLETIADVLARQEKQKPLG